MSQYNTFNVKLFNWQLNKFKSGIKNGTEVTLNLSLNVIGNSNDETNFSYKSLSTNTLVSRLCKAFTNGSSANIKLSKTQMHKIGQSWAFFGRILEPFLKASLPLKKCTEAINSKYLIPLGLTAAASATVQLPKENIWI